MMDNTKYKKIASVTDNGYTLELYKNQITHKKMLSLLKGLQVETVSFTMEKKQWVDRPQVDDLRKMRSWYNGRTYFQLPINYTVSDRGVVQMARGDESSDSYALISKRDIKIKFKNMRLAKKNIVNNIATMLLDEYIRKFNIMSRGHVYTARLITPQGKKMLVGEHICTPLMAEIKNRIKQCMGRKGLAEVDGIVDKLNIK